MKNGHTRERMRRLASLLLAVVVAVTFMPFLGDDAYADSGNTKKSIKNAKEKLRYVDEETGEEIDPSMLSDPEEALNNFSIEDINIDNGPKEGILTAEPLEDDSTQVNDDQEAEEPAPLITDKEELAKIFPDGSLPDTSAYSDSKVCEGDKATDITDIEEEKVTAEENAVSDDEGSELIVSSIDTKNGEELESNEVAAKDLVPFNNCVLTAAPNYSDATLSISAYIKSGYTGSYRISVWGLINSKGEVVGAVEEYRDSFAYSLNMRGFPTGYYTIVVYIQQKKSNKWIDYGYTTKENIQFDYVSIAPDTSGSYEAYSTYFNYQKWDPRYVQGYRLYIDYWTPGGAVTTKYMQNYYTTYQFGGLVPNTVYNIRFRYGLPAHNTVMFGPYSGTTAIRTGIAKLPKIKSVKVKAYKVKKRRAGVYGWYTGYYFGSVKYYTYKIKVTVEFKTKKKKRKPGLNGLYINGVWKSGNKKKYTLKLGPYANYSKPKGKKFNVYLYSAHAPGGYGGYSPMYSKTKKVK